MKEKNKTSILIGISSCLLGEKVRYDAGHKQDRYITDVLGRFFEFVPVCPEIEVGMGVPREAVRLVGNPANPRMIGVRSGKDWSNRMLRFAEWRVEQKDLISLSGYILKSKSPSCGMERVNVYVEPNRIAKTGTGLFAASLSARFPDLPIEEEGRLADSAIRENFIERVFAYNRLQDMFSEPYSRAAIIAFHAKHKFLLLAHSPEHHRKLGQLTAQVKQIRPEEFKNNYRHLFMQALKFKATVRKNTNVLQHIAGFLKDRLTPLEKNDLIAAIEDYRTSLVPLIVPITLLRHFVRKYQIEYIDNQYYLNPHPKELMLRNHV